MNSKLYDKLVDYDFKSLFAKKHYAYFTEGSYNMNIIGVRAKTDKVVTNKFDDFIILDYKDESGKWCRQIYKATTDPGITWLNYPMDVKGCAMMVPGQYRGLWRIGMHKGKYKALVQNRPVTVYRDNNKDSVYDIDAATLHTGVFGINLHHAGADSVQVDKWSAGCQVVARLRDFQQLMSIVSKQKASTYTYTLIKEEDL